MLEEAQPLPDDIAALKAMVLVSRAELRTLKVIASNRLTVIGTCSFPVEVRKRPAGFRRLRLFRPARAPLAGLTGLRHRHAVL